jgi:ferredoxin, 2Fe-2S
MGGTNPYLKGAQPEPAKKKFKVTFTNTGTVFEVDPAHLPYGETGLPGSVLDIALAGAKVEIDHACGGVCACSTCHVYVKQGLESCSEASEAEQDMLYLAPDLKPNSRLACQCVPNGNTDLVVEIPDWNRNLVREGK